MGGTLRVAEDAAILGEQMVQVSRFGCEPVEPEVLAVVLTATVGRQALVGTYENLTGICKAIHIMPRRVVLIGGDWYLFAWSADRVKTYRLSRLHQAQASHRPPPGLPTYLPEHEIDRLVVDAFRATASPGAAARYRVVLAVSPTAWPQLRNRRWGDRQRWEDAPPDLPIGWRRLSFTTCGLDDCTHWVLSHGAGVRAEAPTHLRERIREHVQLMAAAMESGA